MDKKTIELIGAIFVAVIFLTSYAAFGNNGGASTTTTTTIYSGQTIYAYGNTTASIVGYTPAMSATISCSANMTDNESTLFNNVLANMEANNTVSNYYLPTSSQFVIESGTLNSSGIFEVLYRQITVPERSCTSFSSSAILKLAPSANFTVQGQKLQVSLASVPSEYTLPVNLTINQTLKYRLRIAALLTENGTIYGNLTVVSAKGV